MYAQYVCSSATVFFIRALRRLAQNSMCGLAFNFCPLQEIMAAFKSASENEMKGVSLFGFCVWSFLVLFEIGVDM
jgi:hypothetical protein